jgi:BirA family biotin operon repressor/biotin-[acetyl-CoA-carboxylase] ligase
MPPLEPAVNVSLLARGLPGLADPITQTALSAMHPLWAADLAAAGPLAEHPAELSAGPADIVVCGVCSSTMDVARELCAQGMLAPWGSVIAPAQRAGRGQLRRPWLSDPGNMLATLACPPEDKPWNDLRPLVLGHLFGAALGSLGPSVSVKWPNDLLVAETKVAGMLVEERGGCVLCGIGVNLAWAPPAEVLREGHVVAAGRFAPSDADLGPLRLWAALVNHVETGYIDLLDACTPTDFLTIFRSRLAWLGRRVLVHEGAGVRYEAMVKGVSGEGGLVLDRAGEEVVLLSGDVTPV